MLWVKIRVQIRITLKRIRSHLFSLMQVRIHNIGLPVSCISVRYRSIPVPDWVHLFQYCTGSGIGIFVHSGTGLIRCRTDIPAFWKESTPCLSILLVVERDKPCTPILLAVEGDTPCTSILLALERHTPCTSILLVVEMDTLSPSVLLAVERDTPCPSILLAAEMDTPFTSILPSVELDTPCTSILLAVEIDTLCWYWKIICKCRNAGEKLVWPQFDNCIPASEFRPVLLVTD